MADIIRVRCDSFEKFKNTEYRSVLGHYHNNSNITKTSFALDISENILRNFIS